MDGGGTGTSAGVATEDVTPTWPVRETWSLDSPLMASYHPVEVKALAIRDGSAPVVIVTADVGSFCPAVTERVYAAVARLGLTPERMVLNASHNHNAPAICGQAELADTTWIDERYETFFVGRVARAIERALADMRPASLSTTDGSCSVCVNRRKPPTYWLTPNPDGYIDRRVRLLLVKDTNTDKLRAALALFACHPSDIGKGSFGAEFFGFARDEVARTFPDVAILTAQGSAGDIRLGHVSPDGQKFTGTEVADLSPNKEFGRQLGAAIVKALGQASVPVKGRIRAAMSQVMIPRKEPEARDFAARAARGEDPTYPNDPYKMRWGREVVMMYDQGIPFPRTRPFDVRVLRLGDDLTVAALNGEIFTCIARQIEEALAPRRTFVMGYSNGVEEYIPCALEIRQGGYEPDAYWLGLQLSPLDPGTDQVIVNEAITLARRL